MGWRAHVFLPVGAGLSEKNFRAIKMQGLSDRNPTDEPLAAFERRIGLDVFDDEASTAEEAGAVAVQSVVDVLAGPDVDGNDVRLLDVAPSDTQRETQPIADGSTIEGEVISVTYDDDPT